MAENINMRNLKEEEIECRIGTIKNNGLSLLLYKDARVDQRILDEAFGAFGWMRRHEVIDGSVYCIVSIRDPESREWISKQDVGSAGNAEKEKSLAFDSFKRACVNWGIGRELYSAPFIWIPAERTSIIQNNGKWHCDDAFRVSSIAYDAAKEICLLEIENRKREKVFSWKKGNAGTAQEGSLTRKQKDDLRRELERTGVSKKAVHERFHVSDPEEMSPAVYEELMKALAQTKSKRAA